MSGGGAGEWRWVLDAQTAWQLGRPTSHTGRAAGSAAGGRARGLSRSCAARAASRTPNPFHQPKPRQPKPNTKPSAPGAPAGWRRGPSASSRPAPRSPGTQSWPGGRCGSRLSAERAARGGGGGVRASKETTASLGPPPVPSTAAAGAKCQAPRCSPFSRCPGWSRMQPTNRKASTTQAAAAPTNSTQHPPAASSSPRGSCPGSAC